jgi:hypothetical protein
MFCLQRCCFSMCHHWNTECAWFEQVKDFVLSQDEAYEFKLGNAAFRRPGDPPLEVVVEKLEEEKKALKKAQKAAEKKAAEEKDENVSFKEEL